MTRWREIGGSRRRRTRSVEKVAAGKDLSSGECERAGFIADFLNSRYEREGCWIETRRQKHDRFLDVKLQREKHNLEEARGKADSLQQMRNT